MKDLAPTVWVLLGARAGDNAQAVEVARRLGGAVQTRQLLFGPFANLPNWLVGTGFAGLSKESRHTLTAPWPDIVVAAGRRSAPVSLAIKTASAGKTIAVHIGRPRMNLDRFDLVLTTPQYGLPPGPNVVVLTLPFAVARDVSAKVQSHFGEVWGHLPRPWLVGVIGAAKFPIRFGPSEIGAFAKAADGLAHSLKGSLILMDSPRSPPGAIADVAARVTAPHWMWTRGQGDNPYQAALKMGDCFAVTSDSASMMAEMVRTRRPTYVHRLPVSPITPVWRAQSGLPALLARRGILSPPRDVGRFVDHLSAQGWIGNLQSGAGPQSTFAASDEHDAAIERILTLWRGHAAD